MRPKAMRAVVLLQLAAGSLAQAQDQGERLFPPQPTGYVTDVAGVIDAGSSQAMTAKIQRLRDATGAEIAVVTLPTIGDRAAVDVAVAIGRAWGVGAAADVGDQRRNAGLIMLLVPRREGDPNSGQIFIATGRGLEGIVTDATAGRVRDLMRPHLSAGEYGAGLQVGVDALAAIVAQGLGVSDSSLTQGGRAVHRRGTGQTSPRVTSLIVSAVVVAIGIAIISSMIRGAMMPPGRRRRRRRGRDIFFGGPGWGGGFGGFGGGFGGGGFGGFGGGGGFSGGGAGGRF
ncbi:MAG TPA: TPM domain-containing protein [Gemmatimonadales bacterium]